MAHESTITDFEDYGERSPIIDTSFILFFVALDFGQSFDITAFDTIFMGFVLVAVAVIPYFLMNEATELRRWIIGRTAIVSFGAAAGVMFKLSLGTLVPETFGFLPFTLLLLTAVLFCIIQFANLLRLRLSN